MPATPLCSTPSGSLLPLSPPAMSLASATTTASEALEQNPPDLVCPITQDIFTEPVINGAGQVYERAAIEMHMRRSNLDPVTRMQLHPSSGLTPVWIVKSRSVPFAVPKPRRTKQLLVKYLLVSRRFDDAEHWSIEKRRHGYVSSTHTLVLVKMLSDISEGR